jgi:hypothetical protein
MASWKAGRMRTTWATLTAVTALVMTSGLAGCAADGSGAAGGPTATPSSVTTSPVELPNGDTACPYLTAAQVSAALGSPTRQTAGSINACFFDPAGPEGPGVLLSRVDVQIDPADYARQSRHLCLGEVTDVHAGDEAFACVMGLGPQGQLYVGRVLVTVGVSDATDEATGIAAAAALLPEVTIPARS